MAHLDSYRSGAKWRLDSQPPICSSPVDLEPQKNSDTAHLKIRSAVYQWIYYVGNHAGDRLFCFGVSCKTSRIAVFRISTRAWVESRLVCNFEYHYGYLFGELV